MIKCRMELIARRPHNHSDMTRIDRDDLTGSNCLWGRNQVSPGREVERGKRQFAGYGFAANRPAIVSAEVLCKKIVHEFFGRGIGKCFPFICPFLQFDEAARNAACRVE